MTADTGSEFSVAIIGMACRFPGAPDLAAFWKNLRDGVDSISRFTEEELTSFGIPRSVYLQQDFVPAVPMIADADCFDPAFFGYSGREATLMDPQHRVFLQLAWQALEDSGYRSDDCPNATGVFAGTSLSSYLLYNLLPNFPDPHLQDNLQLMIGNDKDFLASRVSYKLNLHGASLDVQTGCSTSLVAVHLACQNLLSYQCDLALAGGVSVHTPRRFGYRYQAGGLASSDGRCRAFDQDADGTIFGSGAGCVVLKRLNEALDDRDHIYAVVRGSAINNDGSAKLGFTAPSVSGQTEVIRAAQAAGQTSARSITYVECHGTATPLGDPAEILALYNAFRTQTADTNFCAVGSVKSNIGHLDAAAGIAGLIKTALALQHAELPPTLHCETPNPQIDWENSPFFINTSLRPWPRAFGPRRAGVSSFGIGGTNAHVIVEEWPSAQTAKTSRLRHLVCLSAKTRPSLDGMWSALGAFLETSSDYIADVAYTLQAGRARFPLRRAAIYEDEQTASDLFSAGTWAVECEAQSGPHEVVFMFPGGGSQHLEMGAGLYRTEPVFRKALDECARLFSEPLQCDIRSQFLNLGPTASAQEDAIRGTKFGLPALFSVEFALAQLWQDLGLRPSAVIGHSLGEYTAATVAGVVSLEDAVELVACRAKLMDTLPPSRMLSVPIDAADLSNILDPELSIAAINAPGNTIVSGEAAAIDRMCKRFDELDIDFRILQIAVGSHSSAVEPILEEFSHFSSRLAMRPPSVPMISNLTGTWITDNAISDPQYWVRHLREPVLFRSGIEELLTGNNRSFLEVGPGNSLTTLVRATASPQRTTRVFQTMRHPRDKEKDETVFHRAAAQLWAHGIVEDWTSMYKDEVRHRVPLPTYSFERRRCWYDPPARSVRPAWQRNAAQLPRVYALGWQGAGPVTAPVETKEASLLWVVIGRQTPFCQTLIARLKSRSERVLVLLPTAASFEKIDDDFFRVRPELQEDYQCALDNAIRTDKPSRIKIISALDTDGVTDGESYAALSTKVCNETLVAIPALLGAYQAVGHGTPMELCFLSSNVWEIESGDVSTPVLSSILGFARSIPQENPAVRCRFIDIGNSNRSPDFVEVDAIVEEILSVEAPLAVARRGRNRWQQAYLEVDLSKHLSAPLGEAKVYVILGGTGEIGLELGRHLIIERKAKVLLVGRRPVNVSLDPASDPSVDSRSLLRESADLQMFSADVRDVESLRGALVHAVSAFGKIDGIFHLAGVTGEAAVHLAADSTTETIERIIAAKATGASNLEQVAIDFEPSFVALFSSTAAHLGGVGLASYAAANCVLESVAVHADRTGATRWLSLAWDAWLTPRYSQPSALPGALLDQALTPKEALSVLFAVVQTSLHGNFIVSRNDWEARVQGEADVVAPSPRQANSSAAVGMSLARDYVAPVNELESVIARAWEQHLGEPRIGRHDKFFELGGTSLLALRIVSELKRDLGREIPIVALFEGGSISGMAEILSKNRTLDDALDVGRIRGEERRRLRSSDQYVVAYEA